MPIVARNKNGTIARTHRKITKTCLCGSSFVTNSARVEKNRGKFCSKKCAYKYRVVVSGSDHHNWKENPGYHAIHDWIRRKLGKPSVCDTCGTKEAIAYDWANLSGEYKRDPDDWSRMCRSCHIHYDDILKKAWKTRRIKNVM